VNVVAANPAFAWHEPGNATVVAGTAHPLVRGPHTPFAAVPGAQQVTAIMAGTNETHDPNPTSIVRALDGSSLFAIAAALQADNPSLVPVIAIDNLAYGSAPGAPVAAVVPRGRDIVGLFSSAAASAGGLLEDDGRAETFRTSYAALAGLNRAADRSTTQTSYATGRRAATFVGMNLADQLSIDAADTDRYGLTVGGVPAAIPADVRELGETLIVTAKAFAMGLTRSVIVPGPRDDPHTAFDDMDALRAKLTALRTVLDAFMADLARLTDDLTDTALIDDIVLTIDGDTPKTPLDRIGWGDDTPERSNWLYVYSGGLLKSGWFGGIGADATVTGFDPATGLPADPDPDAQAKAANAAIAYAIANRRTDLVRPFARAEYTGLIT
jgi:hypothetical protein